MFEIIFIVGFLTSFFIIVVLLKMILVFWEGRFLQTNNEKWISLAPRLWLYFAYMHTTKELRFAIHIK